MYAGPSAQVADTRDSNWAPRCVTRGRIVLHSKKEENRNRFSAPVWQLQVRDSSRLLRDSVDPTTEFSGRRANPGNHLPLLPTSCGAAHRTRSRGLPEPSTNGRAPSLGLLIKEGSASPDFSRAVDEFVGAPLPSEFRGAGPGGLAHT